MSEWVEKKLGDLMIEASGPKVENPAEYPLLTVRLRGQGVEPTGKFPNKTSSGRPHLIRRPGQILIGRQNFHSGSAGVVPELDREHVTSNAISAFEARPGVDSRFLLHLLQWPKTAADAEVLMGGTGQREISLKNLLALSVRVPTPTKQRRIVDVVAAVDGQVEALENEASRLRDATAAVTKSLLSPRDDWEKVSISDVAICATGRAFPDRYQGVTEGVLPYFKVADMNMSGNEREMRIAPNWLTEETITEVKPRVCSAGTVVFPIIGAALLTEKRRILTQPSAFDQNIMGLIPNGLVTSEYMFAVMSNVRLGDFSRTSAVPSVNQKVVGAIKFYVPPTMEEQRAIGERVQALHQQQEALAVELANLLAFRAAFLTNLLNEEIEIPESYDALLEGIA